MIIIIIIMMIMIIKDDIENDNKYNYPLFYFPCLIICPIVFPIDSSAACPRGRRAHPELVGASLHPAAQGGATVTVTAGGGRRGAAAGLGE